MSPSLGGASGSGSVVAPGANVGASVVADVAPSLPLTITADVNDQFVYTPAATGVPETFTLNPDTYTTLAELIAVLNGRFPDPDAFGTRTAQFSDVVLASPESGKILLTSLAPGAVGNGDTITEGNGGAAALGFTANPDTFAGGLSAAVVSNPAVGARESYTFIEGDAIDPSSWWATNTGGETTSIHVWGQWSPEASGALELLSPPYTPDNYPESYWIFLGQTPNVNYPDGSAASGAFSGVPLASVVSGDPSAAVHIDAANVYTIIVADSSGGAGETIDLAPLLNSLAAFGGLDQDPPPLPLGIDFVLSRTSYGAPRWRPGPASDADVLLGSDMGTLSVAVHWGGGLFFQAPVVTVSLLEDKLFPGRWHSISLIDFLAADDHIGPEIGGFPFSHAPGGFRITDWRFVVIRLDGTASIDVHGASTFTSASDPTDTGGADPVYNVPSSILNWAAPTAQSGTDLTADADNHWIHTTAGGGMFIYTELLLEVD